MYNIFYQFFIEQFFNNTLPNISWQVTTIEIASIVMCFLVVFLAILIIASIIGFILKLCRGLWN